jgi:hypothetical protein
VLTYAWTSSSGGGASLCIRWDAHDGNVMPLRLAAMITSFHAIVTL